MKKTYIAPEMEIIAMHSTSILAGSPEKSGKANFEVGSGENQGGISGPITTDNGEDESDAKFGRLNWNSDWNE